MKTHIDSLSVFIPDIFKRRILDVGSDRGYFLIYMTLCGARPIGLEMSDEHIERSYSNAKEKEIDIEVEKGNAENMPFKNEEFGFINVGEVVEHVEDPIALFREVYRVLKKNGYVYMSVPNRFSMKDPHYHLYFVNWFPRSMCNTFIGILGKQKGSTKEAGRQRLNEMHYYTFSKIKKLLRQTGFNVTDIREKKICLKVQNPILQYGAILLYKIIRPWYFQTFHLLLRKYE
ncbi:MAG: class I SAM-dependent methyltransferase [Parcubacteria group bacterium]